MHLQFVGVNAKVELLEVLEYTDFLILQIHPPSRLYTSKEWKILVLYFALTIAKIEAIIVVLQF